MLYFKWRDGNKRYRLCGQAERYDLDMEDEHDRLMQWCQIASVYRNAFARVWHVDYFGFDGEGELKKSLTFPTSDEAMNWCETCARLELATAGIN